MMPLHRYLISLFCCKSGGHKRTVGVSKKLKIYCQSIYRPKNRIAFTIFVFFAPIPRNCHLTNRKWLCLLCDIQNERNFGRINFNETIIITITAINKAHDCNRSGQRKRVSDMTKAIELEQWEHTHFAPENENRNGYFDKKCSKFSWIAKYLRFAKNLEKINSSSRFSKQIKPTRYACNRVYHSTATTVESPRGVRAMVIIIIILLQ